MINTSALTALVVQILDQLSVLPGRNELSVETRRYPRLLPAESGEGFEQRHWSFDSPEVLQSAGMAIPPDAEDVVVTWKGGLDDSEGMGEVKTRMGTMLSHANLATSWDCEIFARRRQTPNPQMVIRVFRNGYGGALS